MMDNSSPFLVIAVTPSQLREDEAEMITRLLADGAADYVHLRHPDISCRRMRDLLQRIPAHFHNRLTLHDFYSLAEEFNVGGIHLNGRNPDVPCKLLPRLRDIRVSRSCHSVEELVRCASDPVCRYDYLTLSPIYDSISKPGYSSRFSLDELRVMIPTVAIRIIALGGVTPSRFPELKDCGFSGAALLGHFWQ